MLRKDNVTQLEDKRKFLIAANQRELQDRIKISILPHFPNAQFVVAQDGSDAILKIQNDCPHVVITTPDLAKTNGFKLTQWILRSKPNEKIAIVLLSPIPTAEQFVDAVVTSQLQFADPAKGDVEFQKILMKAVSYSCSTAEQEFFARFLSPGEQLIKAGEKADNVYLVKKGELAATLTKDQEKVFLGKIVSGEFVGEMAYINGEPRSADVHAVEASELIVIPVDVLDQVLFTKPAWSKALMKTLTKRLKIANQKAS